MKLPSRKDVLIRGAYVMTMDPAVGDLAYADVLIRDGRIAEVGRSVAADSIEVIDAQDLIALPGLVDSHTHLWTSQMKGRFGDTRETVYFRERTRLSDGYTAEDMYVGTLLGAVECVYSGITTATDFCHNIRGEDFALQSLRGLAESGLRTRFLFGASTRAQPHDSIDLRLVDRLARSWEELAGDAPLTLGLAWRGPLGVTAVEPGRKESPAIAVAKKEFDAANALGLPIAVHVSGVNAAAQFTALARGDFLTAAVQLIHMSGANAEQLALIAERNASISITPLTELRVGYGVTQLGDYLESGARVGIGIDSTSLAGSADMFSVMKLFQLIEAGRKKDELAITARRLLELATIEGARSIGMEDEIGSITRGKRADLVLIDTTAINMGLFAADPSHLIVEAARPHNVDTVIIDGRVLKRGGRMTSVNPGEIVRMAKRSIESVGGRLEA